MFSTSGVPGGAGAGGVPGGGAGGVPGALGYNPAAAKAAKYGNITKNTRLVSFSVGLWYT